MNYDPEGVASPKGVIRPFSGSELLIGLTGGVAPGYWISRFQREENFCLLLTAPCLLFTAHCSLLDACTFDRITGSLPGCQTTQQRCRIIDSFGFEFDHRTGARMFVWSSTVGHDHFVLWQLF
jgi:hypothetical protein